MNKDNRKDQWYECPRGHLPHQGVYHQTQNWTKNDQKVLEQKAKSHQTGREKDKQEETVEKIL